MTPAVSIDRAPTRALQGVGGLGFSKIFPDSWQGLNADVGPEMNPLAPWML